MCVEAVVGGCEACCVMLMQAEYGSGWRVQDGSIEDIQEKKNTSIPYSVEGYTHVSYGLFLESISLDEKGYTHSIDDFIPPDKMTG